VRRWIISSMLVPVLALGVGCGPSQTANNSTNPALVANQAGNLMRQPMQKTHHNLRVEQAIADEVTRIAHVKSSSVLLVGNTAYVAVELRQGTHTTLAKQTKDQIIRYVKSKHREVRTVWVSANPDAYQHFQRFAADINKGRPVDAIWGNFTSLVQRVWPNAK
jgi:YhcN/YlaJ family sporulation lipoprotein